MIAKLSGSAAAPDVINTAGGVAYRVHTPDPLVVGEDVGLWIHTAWPREGGPVMYGFSHPEELAVFEALVRIHGVGGSAALALLRTLGVTGIATAAGTGDTQALTAVRGIGIGTARRIVGELRLDELDLEAGPGEPSLAAELRSTLEALGWTPESARGAVEAAMAGGDADEATLLRRALDSLT